MLYVEDVELSNLILLMKTTTIKLGMLLMFDILKECLLALLCDICFFMLPFNPHQGLQAYRDKLATVTWQNLWMTGW